MASFDIAHLREQGQDLIIVPLDSSFGHKSSGEQQHVIASLQACARSAGLAGTVVPVWEDGFGRMAFIAPRPWHPFFQSIGMDFVTGNINRRLMCA
jgi:hypothetical protein